MAFLVVRAAIYRGFRSHPGCGSVVNRISHPLLYFCSIHRRFCESDVSPDIKFYEPPYLIHLKPPLPVNNLVNIQLRGYDFSVLERFSKFIKKVVIEFGLDISDAWATPRQSFRVTTVKPNSNVIENAYQVSLFERNIQILHIPAARVSVFVSVIQASLPPGVKFSFHSHGNDHEEIRYVPNLELIELEEQFAEAYPKR